MSELIRTAVVAALILSGCARGNPQAQTEVESQTTAPPVAQETTAPTRQQGELFQLSDGTAARFYGEADVRGKEKFRIEMGSAGSGSFYFSPTVLIGTPGQRLTLEIFNGDKEGHPFEVKGQSGIPTVAPGKTETITVTFPSAGAATFLCPHEGHAGELRVE